MKFVIDAQLPPALAQWLREQEHQADHVAEIGLREAEDSPIWQFALEQNAVLLTKDEDFAGRVRQSREIPVIVWLRIGNCSNRALRGWFFPLLPAVLREIESGQRFIEVR
jgi:predicted nuclease of predicted toxin-antitoxin system